MAADAAKEQTQSGLMRYDVVKVESGKVLVTYGSTHHFHTASKRRVGVGQGMMSSQANVSWLFVFEYSTAFSIENSDKLIIALLMRHATFE